MEHRFRTNDGHLGPWERMRLRNAQNYQSWRIWWNKTH